MLINHLINHQLTKSYHRWLPTLDALKLHHQIRGPPTQLLLTKCIEDVEPAAGKWINRSVTRNDDACRPNDGLMMCLMLVNDDDSWRWRSLINPISTSHLRNIKDGSQHHDQFSSFHGWLPIPNGNPWQPSTHQWLGKLLSARSCKINSLIQWVTGINFTTGNCWLVTFPQSWVAMLRLWTWMVIDDA